MKTKPAAQMSLEAIVRRNKEEAARLLSEVERIEVEMSKILSDVPPASRLVDAFTETLSDAVPRHKNGVSMEKMELENAMTLPPVSRRLAGERDVVYVALAMVSSWRRRKKKHYSNQERELVRVVEALEDERKAER